MRIKMRIMKMEDGEDGRLVFSCPAESDEPAVLILPYESHHKLGQLFTVEVVGLEEPVKRDSDNMLPVLLCFPKSKLLLAFNSKHESMNVQAQYVTKGMTFHNEDSEGKISKGFEAVEDAIACGETEVTILAR